jgi:hypothetical protein
VVCSPDMEIVLGSGDNPPECHQSLCASALSLIVGNPSG